MRKKLFYCLSALFFILSSCSSDDDSLSENTILPQKLKISNPENPSANFVVDFVYDGNKIVSINNKFEKIEYTYDENKIVKQVKYSLENNLKKQHSETFYSYRNNSLQTARVLTNDTETLSVYSYQDDGAILKETYAVDKETRKESKTTERKVLSFINGNLIKSVFNWGDNYDITTETHYDYDANDNAFKNVLGFNLLLDQDNFGDEINCTSASNLKIAHVFVISGPAATCEHNFNSVKFDYNKKGYPVKKTTSEYSGKIIEMIEFIY